MFPSNPSHLRATTVTVELSFFENNTILRFVGITVIFVVNHGSFVICNCQMIASSLASCQVFVLLWATLCWPYKVNLCHKVTVGSQGISIASNIHFRSRFWFAILIFGIVDFQSVLILVNAFMQPLPPEIAILSLVEWVIKGIKWVILNDLVVLTKWVFSKFQC